MAIIPYIYTHLRQIWLVEWQFQVLKLKYDNIWTYNSLQIKLYTMFFTNFRVLANSTFLHKYHQLNTFKN